MNNILFEKHNDLNTELLLLEESNEALSLAKKAYHKVDNDTQACRDDLNIAKYLTGYKNDIALSKEGIISFVNILIEKIVDFLKKIWQKFIALLNSYRKNISNDTKEYDKMLKHLDETVSNEKMTTSKILVKIPDFLNTTPDSDKLNYYESFFELVKNIKIETFIGIDKHLLDVINYLNKKETNLTPYNIVYRNKILPMYDNNSELSSILANLYDHIVYDTNMNKAIIGYTTTSIIILDKNLSLSYKIPYKSSDVVIHIPDYIPNLHKHLNYLKEYTLYVKKENEIIKLIDSRMRKIKSSIKKITDKNIDDVSNVVNDITVSIPLVLKSYDVTTFSMYAMYKKTIKEIYNNID